MSASAPVTLLYISNFFEGPGLTYQYCKELAERLEGVGIRVLRRSFWRSRLLRFVDMASAPLRQRRNFSVGLIDVFSGPSFVWASAAAVALRAVRKPFAMTLHGGNLPVFAKRYPAWVRWSLNLADAVTAPSGYLADRMRPFRHDICVIPNAIELSRYPFELRTKPRPKLIWLRAFHEMYGPHVAAECARLLLPEFPTLQLSLVGPDKGDGSIQRVKKFILEHGLQEHMQIVPGVPKSEVPKVLSQHDIFLNPVFVDNTPVTLIETMACGLCVVSSDAGGVPYIVQDNVNGLLVPCDDPQAMADAVRRLLVTEGLAEQLSQNARRQAEQLDWGQVLPKWKSLLLNLV